MIGVAREIVTTSLFALAIAIPGAPACGGKVFLDGAGGAETSSVSSSSSSSSTGAVTCFSDTCDEDSTTCTCVGSCAGHAAATICTLTSSGTQCECIWEDAIVGACALTPEQVCNIDGSCCKAVFGLE
jgi:hypothetical protein